MAPTYAVEADPLNQYAEQSHPMPRDQLTQVRRITRYQAPHKVLRLATGEAETCLCSTEHYLASVAAEQGTAAGAAKLAVAVTNGDLRVDCLAAINAIVVSNMRLENPAVHVVTTAGLRP